MGISSELKTIEEYETLVAELRAANAKLLKTLWTSEDNYDALATVHEEVCAECNVLSDEVTILKIDLDDMTVEFEALSEEYAIAFDALAEAGLIEALEVDDYNGEEAAESLVVPFKSEGEVN